MKCTTVWSGGIELVFRPNLSTRRAYGESNHWHMMKSVLERWRWNDSAFLSRFCFVLLHALRVRWDVRIIVVVVCVVWYQRTQFGRWNYCQLEHISYAFGTGQSFMSNRIKCVDWLIWHQNLNPGLITCPSCRRRMIRSKYVRTCGRSTRWDWDW